MYDRILLATDGTAASTDAEGHAIELADAHDAALHVLYVLDEDVYTAYSGDEYVDEAEGPEHGLEEHGSQTLARIREDAEAVGVDVVEALEHGDPAETVVRYASEQSADVIVLGTRRRPDAYRALLGSVTDRVVRLAATPTLVVKTDVSG